MVILNDRTPPQGHDPELIVRQLRELADVLHYKYILLDFQRPGLPENTAVAKALVTGLPYPVGVSELYATELDCPVFLPPAPPHVPLREYLAPWQGREIWLEAALDAVEIVVTQSHCDTVSIPHPPQADGFLDDSLFCHYITEVSDDAVRFTLWRTKEDLDRLLEAAAAFGVTQAVGLWQELG